MEAKKRRLKEEAEERLLKMKAEEKQFERGAKLQPEKFTAKVELERLLLERARSRVECKSIKARTEVQPVASSQAGQVVALTETFGLLNFVKGEHNLNKYLFQFERYAAVAGWQRDIWAVGLVLLLTDKALDVYSGFSRKDAPDNEKLPKTLLQRYDFTEQGYRKRFWSTKPEGKNQQAS